MEAFFLQIIYKYNYSVFGSYATFDGTLSVGIRNDKENMIKKKNFWFIILLAIAAGMVLAAGCTTITTNTTPPAPNDKVFLEKADYHTTTVNGTMYELMSRMNEMDIGGSIVQADELKAEADSATTDLSNLTVSPQNQAYKDELLQAFSNLSRGASSVNQSLMFLSQGNQTEAIRVSEEGGPIMDLGVEHLEKAKSMRLN